MGTKDDDCEGRGKRFYEMWTQHVVSLLQLILDYLFLFVNLNLVCNMLAMCRFHGWRT